MNEFERVRRKILINKDSDSVPFPYYVKITPAFKQYVTDHYEMIYKDWVNGVNLQEGEVVASGDYIKDTYYDRIFSDVAQPLSVNLSYAYGYDNGFVSEVKVSNDIHDVITIMQNPFYVDSTVSIMDLGDINTTVEGGEYVLMIYNLKVSEDVYQGGALQKLILPKNLNNTEAVVVRLYCYLDTKDVEIIHPTDGMVYCPFIDYKAIYGVPTNKFILKVPFDYIEPYTNYYSYLAQNGQVYGNYEIVGY